MSARASQPPARPAAPASDATALLDPMAEDQPWRHANRLGIQIADLIRADMSARYPDFSAIEIWIAFALALRTFSESILPVPREISPPTGLALRDAAEACLQDIMAEYPNGPPRRPGGVD